MTIELLKDHWVNGRLFRAGTILDLPDAEELKRLGVAREPVRPQPIRPTLNPKRSPRTN